MLYVTLKAVGNPDLGQPPDLGIQPRVVPVRSLEEAREICQLFIAALNLGGGNWAGGLVLDNHGREAVRVAYNGRFIGRTYRVIWKRDDNGTRGVHCPGPFTHDEACTVLRKLSPQPWRRDLLEEI